MMSESTIAPSMFGVQMKKWLLVFGYHKCSFCQLWFGAPLSRERRTCAACARARYHEKREETLARLADKYKNDATFRERLHSHSKKQRQVHPERFRARKILGNAIRLGSIKRQPCERCGAIEAEGHHEDYSRPLDVQWLCKVHHHARHCEIRDLARNTISNSETFPIIHVV